MMATEKKKSRAWSVKTAAVIMISAVTILVVWKYAQAVADGIAWKRSSDWDMVAPNYNEPDTNRAKKVPNFTLKDRFGNQVRLSQFASVDLLLVNMWSSGCPPCFREMPSLSELDRRLGTLGNVALITITIDEKWEDVTSFFPSGTDMRVLFDPEKKVVEGVFGTKKFPETFILDKDRRIRARFDGERVWHSKEMLDYIASYK
ncbi:MAG: TlpA family protein disulfide reductase [Proteobacteria bacterium]|nr:TlpA family protein disulfide reductase [Pseudomonadota bacterium]